MHLVVALAAHPAVVHSGHLEPGIFLGDMKAAEEKAVTDGRQELFSLVGGRALLVVLVQNGHVRRHTPDQFLRSNAGACAENKTRLVGLDTARRECACQSNDSHTRSTMSRVPIRGS